MGVIKEKKTKYKGIRLRNNMIWIDFRYKGVRCREPYGKDGTEKNITSAYNERISIFNAIDKEKFNYVDYFPYSNNAKKFGEKPKTNLTISETIDWWWQDYERNSSEETIEKYGRDIKNHIKPGLGNILLNDITPRQIRNWLDNISLSNSSKNNILIPLRMVLTEAYYENLISSSLADKLPSYKREKKNKHPFTINEVDALLEYLSPPSKEFYTVSIWTGLSTGEQLGLKWKDVDFSKCLLNIERQIAAGKKIKDTKNGFRKREIDLISPAYDALEILKPKDYDIDPSVYKDEWVFKNPRTNDYWRVDAITKPWIQACKKLKIPYRKPYETRHTFASIMVTACLPDGWIRKQMGHASMRMLEGIYGKYYDNAAEVLLWVKEKTQNGHNGKQFEEFFLNKQ